MGLAHGVSAPPTTLWAGVFAPRAASSLAPLQSSCPPRISYKEGDRGAWQLGRGASPAGGLRCSLRKLGGAWGGGEGGV